MTTDFVGTLRDYRGFVCEHHGPIQPEEMGVSQFTETQWFVWCPECRKWLGFTVARVATREE